MHLKVLVLIAILHQYVNGAQVGNDVLKTEVRADFDVFAGTWNPGGFQYGNPTIINMVQVRESTESVSFEFFPHEYCQALLVCSSPYTDFSGDNPLKVTEDMCTDNFFYVPASGQFKLIQGNAEIKGYVDKLTFEGMEDKHQIKVSKEPFYKSSIYQTEIKDTSILTNKVLLVLSNSRQCQTNVIVDGKVITNDFLVKDRITNELPKSFQYSGNQAETRTFYTDTHSSAIRTQDVFPQIKSWTQKNDKLKNIKFSCHVAGGKVTSGSLIVKPSVLHIKKQQNTDSGGGSRIWRTSIDTGDCHWMRLWITKKSTTWEDYPTRIDGELSQTIDFLFEAGLVFLPDRENAVSLPGSAKQIRKIFLNRYADGIAELAFGHIGNRLINTISFKMDILKVDDLEFFLIRSGSCDARFGADGIVGGILGAGSSSNVPNEVSLSDCKAYSLEPAAAPAPGP
ncbi:unnamed protein product [Caenorhabditis angaria]|uniref:Uncharacterized protein n=1 Tax=Caenorhabditis angaria TaxID=860376 RepID=A0A9P1N032_9PELO|nr:unnamed protein product [Caenorhabditis angaria]